MSSGLFCGAKAVCSIIRPSQFARTVLAKICFSSEKSSVYPYLARAVADVPNWFRGPTSPLSRSSSYSTKGDVAQSLTRKVMAKQSAASHSLIRRRATRRRSSSPPILFRCFTIAGIILSLGFIVNLQSDTVVLSRSVHLDGPGICQVRALGPDNLYQASRHCHRDQ